MKGGWTLAHGGGARDGTVRCLGSEDGTGEVGDAVGFDQRMIAHLHKHRFRNGRRGPCLIRGAVGTKSSYCIEHPRFAKVRASANIKNRQGCNNAARMRVCEVLDPVRKAEPGVEALQLPVADLNCHASRRFEAQKRAINHDSLVPKGRPHPPPPAPFHLDEARDPLGCSEGCPRENLPPRRTICFRGDGRTKVPSPRVEIRSPGQIEQRAESASLVRFYYRRSQHHPRRWREMASILLVPSESLSEPANAMDAES